MEKDIDRANDNWIQSAWEDFDMFLGNRNYKDAEALVDAVGENGFEADALRMHHLLNSAENLFTFYPIEDEEIPTIIPEEDDEDLVGVVDEWRREGDDKFPISSR